jgi:foldase protein PrsA
VTLYERCVRVHRFRTRSSFDSLLSRPVKLRRSLLALGAFFALGAGISACGSGVPGDSVADVAGNPITLQAFNHWMYVAAKGNASQGGASSPVIVPNDPPDFANCIAQARKEIPAVAKQSDKQLRSACQSLFTSLSSQVMDFLIRGYWYQADASNLHIHISNAQVQKEFNTEKSQQYPTASAFQTFLKQSGYTLQDLLFRVRLNLTYKALLAKHNKSITDQQITSYYNSHSSQFGTPETRNLRIVLTKSASQANAAKSALQTGQSWNAVAKKYSTDPATKNKGGVMTNVSQGQGTADQALEKAAFSASVNKLIGPVKGQFGYYVVEVTKITPGTHKTLAQERSLIRQTLVGLQQQTAQSTVDNAAKKHWLGKTTCRGAYAMADCSGFKAPKTSTSATPTPTP